MSKKKLNEAQELQAVFDKEAKIGISALAAALLVAVTYWWRFSAYAVGEPGDWASFGDYFGGLVNPAVGLVTVILVVRTLQATRLEAALTRRQLEAQTEHMRLERSDAARSRKLAELQKRLDEALEQWHRELDAEIPGV